MNIYCESCKSHVVEQIIEILLCYAVRQPGKIPAFFLFASEQLDTLLFAQTPNIAF